MVPRAVVRVVRGRALSLTGPPVLQAYGQGLLPTDCGCGVRVWVPAPPSLRVALRALRLVGAPGVSFGARVARWGGAWHLFSCRGSLHVGRAARVSATRWPLLPGTCLWAVVVVRGSVLWPSLWRGVGAPRLLWSGCSRCSGRLSRRRVAFPYQGLLPPNLLGSCAGHVDAGREPGSWCLPPAPAEAGGLGSLCAVPAWRPAVGLYLAPPSSVGLGLRALRWLMVVDPVTHASGFPYRLSSDGGLDRCTSAVLVWTPTPPLSGRIRPNLGPLCVCLCFLFLTRSGERASRACFGAPDLSFGCWRLLLLSLGPRRAKVGLFFSLFLFPLFLALSAPPVVSGVLCFSALGVLGLCVVFCPPSRLFFLCFFCFPPFPPDFPFPSAPPLSPAFCSSWPQVHLALEPSASPPPLFFCPFLPFLVFPSALFSRVPWFLAPHPAASCFAGVVALQFAFPPSPPAAWFLQACGCRCLPPSPPSLGCCGCRCPCAFPRWLLLAPVGLPLLVVAAGVMQIAVCTTAPNSALLTVFCPVA